MASRAFLTADPHWGHKGIVQFTNPDGTKLRPWNTVDEMDRDMKELWNATVNPEDKVYVAGDWCLNRKSIAIAAELNGRKVLIKGNHDIFRLEDYTPYFYDIRAYHVLPAHRVVVSHIPLHPGQLERWRANIHGHLHGGVVECLHGYDDFGCYVGGGVPDPRYVCVSVEHTGFKPILLDEVLHGIDERLGKSPGDRPRSARGFGS